MLRATVRRPTTPLGGERHVTVDAFRSDDAVDVFVHDAGAGDGAEALAL